MRPQGYVTNPLECIDPLGLSNSSILDRAMSGQVGDKLSAHHVIPVKVWKENSEFFDKIGMSDKMNSVFNGIHILGSKAAMDADLGKGMNVFHSSNHNNYSDDVRQRLSNIKTLYKNKRLNEKSARDAVRKVQIDMKNKI